MKKINYFYVYVYLLIIKKKKVLGTRACQTRVPYYKELKLGKLEYHRRKKESKSMCILQRTQAW